MRRALSLTLGLALAALPHFAQARRTCIETSRVVGFRRCGGTDNWRNNTDGPALALRPALNVGLVQLAPLRFVDAAQRSFAGADFADRWLVGAGPGLDIGVTAFRRVYLGVNAGMLDFHLRTPQSFTLPQWTTVLFANAMHIHVAAVLGVGVAVGPVAFRGTLSVGWQELLVQGAVQRGELQGFAEATAPELLLRPRAALEWFFLPEGSLQCELGIDVATHLSVMTSLAIVLHTRVYDGLHSRN